VCVCVCVDMRASCGPIWQCVYAYERVRERVCLCVRLSLSLSVCVCVCVCVCVWMDCVCGWMDAYSNKETGCGWLQTDSDCKPKFVCEHAEDASRCVCIHTHICIEIYIYV